MIDLDPALLLAALALGEPLMIRTIAFDLPTFDALKGFQRQLESFVKRRVPNASVLKHLILTHPAIANVRERAGYER